MRVLKSLNLLLIIFICYTKHSYSQQGRGQICIDAEPLCASSQFSYPNNSGYNLAETGPDYGCLALQLNPAWFYLQIAEDGDIQLKIEQSTTVGGLPNLDTDFIIYGPFNDPVLPCTNDLNAGNIVDCSFESDFVEFVDIHSVLTGEYYLLMIQNYSTNPGFVTVTQTAGTATTNCNVLNEPEISNLIACEGDILTLSATTTNAIDYIWYEDDGSGFFNVINGIITSEYGVTVPNNYRADALDGNGLFIKRYEFNATFYKTPTDVVANVDSYAFIENNNIQVSVTGIELQQYEYKIDNDMWQENPYFNNVSLGEHLITVRNSIGCGDTSISIMVLDYPHYFTPNGDGVHDTWNIVGLQNQLQAKIYVYNRFGKLLKQLAPNGYGWDGTFNGTKLPTDDYWFTVDYIDPKDNVTKQFKSHFTLKR